MRLEVVHLLCAVEVIIERLKNSLVHQYIFTYMTYIIIIVRPHLSLLVNIHTGIVPA